MIPHRVRPLGPPIHQYEWLPPGPSLRSYISKPPNFVSIETIFLNVSIETKNLIFGQFIENDMYIKIASLERAFQMFILKQIVGPVLRIIVNIRFNRNGIFHVSIETKILIFGPIMEYRVTKQSL